MDTKRIGEPSPEQKPTKEQMLDLVKTYETQKEHGALEAYRTDTDPNYDWGRLNRIESEFRGLYALFSAEEQAELNKYLLSHIKDHNVVAALLGLK